jgi:hypothetical protein
LNPNFLELDEGIPQHPLKDQTTRHNVLLELGNVLENINITNEEDGVYRYEPSGFMEQEFPFDGEIHPNMADYPRDISSSSKFRG